jgi:lysine 2,3-aminomutase
VIYSRQLVDEFGSIHRRYPEVAILIPDTMGRACGGLCAACQRMFDFQNGHLNFNLDALRPGEKWPDKLQRLME